MHTTVTKKVVGVFVQIFQIAPLKIIINPDFSIKVNELLVD
jgi:hypothetical protein